MPFVLLIPLLGLGALAVGAAIVYWKRILNWAEDHLKPWLAQHAPHLVGPVSEAFVALDENIVAIRLAAKEAWRAVRNLLIKQTADFFRQDDGTWLVKIKSWLVDPQQEGAIFERDTRHRVQYDDLPADVRAAYLRRGSVQHSIDITAVRDKEVLSQ